MSGRKFKNEKADTSYGILAGRHRIYQNRKKKYKYKV